MISISIEGSDVDREVSFREFKSMYKRSFDQDQIALEREFTRNQVSLVELQDFLQEVPRVRVDNVIGRFVESSHSSMEEKNRALALIADNQLIEMRIQRLFSSHYTPSHDLPSYSESGPGAAVDDDSPPPYSEASANAEQLSPRIGVEPSFANLMFFLAALPRECVQSRDLVLWWLDEKDHISGRGTVRGEMNNIDTIDASQLRRLCDALHPGFVQTVIHKWVSRRAVDGSLYNALKLGAGFFKEKEDPRSFATTLAAIGAGPGRVRDACVDFYDYNSARADVNACAKFLSECCAIDLVDREDAAFKEFISQFKERLEAGRQADALFSLSLAMAQDVKISPENSARILQNSAVVSMEEEGHLSEIGELPPVMPLREYLHRKMKISIEECASIDFSETKIDKGVQDWIDSVFPILIFENFNNGDREYREMLLNVFKAMLQPEESDKRLITAFETNVLKVFKQYGMRIGYILRQHDGIARLKEIFKNPDPQKIVSDICFATCEIAIRRGNEKVPNPVDEILLGVFHYNITNSTTNPNNPFEADLRNYDPFNEGFSDRLKLSPTGLVNALTAATREGHASEGKFNYRTKKSLAFFGPKQNRYVMREFNWNDFLATHVINDGGKKKSGSQTAEIKTKIAEKVYFSPERAAGEAGTIDGAELVAYFAIKESMPNLLDRRDLADFVTKCETAINQINPQYKIRQPSHDPHPAGAAAARRQMTEHDV